MKIIFICYILLAIFVYLILVGGNINKTDEEREFEDNEQLEYLRNKRNQDSCPIDKKMI